MDSTQVARDVLVAVVEELASAPEFLVLITVSLQRLLPIELSAVDRFFRRTFLVAFALLADGMCFVSLETLLAILLHLLLVLIWFDCCALEGCTIALATATSGSFLFFATAATAGCFVLMQRIIT